MFILNLIAWGITTSLVTYVVAYALSGADDFIKFVETEAPAEANPFFRGVAASFYTMTILVLFIIRDVGSTINLTLMSFVEMTNETVGLLGDRLISKIDSLLVAFLVGFSVIAFVNLAVFCLHLLLLPLLMLIDFRDSVVRAIMIGRKILEGQVA